MHDSLLLAVNAPLTGSTITQDGTQAYSARSSRLPEPSIHSEGVDASQTETPTDVSDSASPWPFSDSRTVTGDVLSASGASTVSITSGGPGNALGPQVFVPLIVVLVLFVAITVFVFARRALRWRRRVVNGPTLVASAHSGGRPPAWPAGTWAERHRGRPNVVVTVERTTSPPVSLVPGASSHSESVAAPEDTTSIFGQDGSALTQLPDSHASAWELEPLNAPSPVHGVKGGRRTRNQPPEAMPPPPPQVVQDETSSSPPLAPEALAPPETGNPDTVLLRLPADLARGLMALVAGSGNAGEARYAGGSENSEVVESLPPYESEPSRPEVNGPRAFS